MSQFIVTQEYYQHANSQPNRVRYVCNDFDDAADYAVQWLLNDLPDTTDQELREIQTKGDNIGIFDVVDYAFVIHRAEEVEGYLEKLEAGLKGIGDFIIKDANNPQVSERQLIFVDLVPISNN